MRSTTDVLPAPPAARTRTRLDYLDGVRAVAALYVVLHHIWITTYPDYPRNTGPMAVGWLLYGHVAVAVFIVVSGFSLSIAPARRGWHLTGGVRTFLRRRAWRILPTYWAALALSCVVFALVTPSLTSDKVSLKAIVVHGLLLQDVINSPKPNGAFWSIAVEWQIYFLFPLLLLLRRRIGPAWLMASVTSAIVVGYLAATHVAPLHRLLNLTPQFVALFVFGIAAAGVVNRTGEPRLRWGWPLAGAALGAAFVLLCVLRGSVWVDAQYFWVDLLVGGGTAAALRGLASGRPRWLYRVLAGRFLRGTGLFSYSIYCVHLPLLWLVWHFVVVRFDLSTGGSFLALLGLGMPVAYAGSYLFSRVFERPFLTHRSFAALRDLLLGALRRPRPAQAGTVAGEPMTMIAREFFRPGP
ncbi:MAG TPA: acyltransferase [Mycobacteriales bacterium]|nr:acyltransferase [Mycobacteriales bacterium]